MWRKGDYFISTDRSLLDHDAIHEFLSVESYWGRGRSRDFVRKSLDNSAYCFGVYHENGLSRQQVGFARVVSDLTTFGYLADVFILSDHRGKGLGKWLLDTIINHPELSEVRRLALFTATPKFYREFGFTVFLHTPQTTFLTRTLAPGGHHPGDLA